MIFTINLLRAEKKAEKYQRMLTKAMVMVPIWIFLIMLGLYVVKNGLVIKYKRDIRSIDAQMANYAGDVKKYDAALAEVNEVKKIASEVAGKVKGFMPFSTVLGCIADNIPAGVVMSDMRVKSSSVQQGNKPGEGSLTKRLMAMSLFDVANPSEGGMVEKYRTELSKHAELNGLVEKVEIASSRSDKYEGKEVMRYDIDCVFKAR